jgi:hypothetical protein
MKVFKNWMLHWDGCHFTRFTQFLQALVDISNTTKKGVLTGTIYTKQVTFELNRNTPSKPINYYLVVSFVEGTIGQILMEDYEYVSIRLESLLASNFIVIQ